MPIGKSACCFSICLVYGIMNSDLIEVLPVVGDHIKDYYDGGNSSAMEQGSVGKNEKSAF